MIAKILSPKNLYKAYRRVVRNKGSSGVDGMGVSALRGFMDEHRHDVVQSILELVLVGSSTRLPFVFS